MYRINNGNSIARRLACFKVLFLFMIPYSLYAQQEVPVKSIVMASEPDYPPYCYIDEDGNAAGFSVELFLAAASVMHMETEVLTGEWSIIKQDLAEGRIDALPMVGRTPERETMFDFSIPYLSLYGGIVVRDDNQDIESYKDLTGKLIAVMKGDNAEEFLRREAGDYRIITTSTFSDALALLSQQQCDAVVIQRLVGLRLITETGFTNLKVLKEPIFDFRQDFCFAVRDGDSRLLALLNEGLSLIMADGTFRRLHTKWFAALELPSRKIIVGGDHNYPPFEFLDEDGRPSGYTVELTKAIAREMGLDVEIYLGYWPDIRHMLEIGEIDVIQGMLYSTERDNIFDFSQPHSVNHVVAVYRTEVKPPELLENLSGMKIVVQAGDIMHDFLLEQQVNAAIVTTDSQEEALRQLASGQHDYAFTGRLAAIYLIEKNGWKNLEIGRKPFLSPEYGYAVKDGSKSLLSHFSEGLAVIEESGEYRSIYEKYIGVYEPSVMKIADLLKYAAFISIPLLLIIAGFFAWNNALRRLVTIQTAALRESEEFQRAIIACSPVALYSINTDGKVQVWNESAERIFGWKKSEVSGASLPIVPENSKEELNDLHGRMYTQASSSNRELFRLKKDGSIFPVSLSTAPIRNVKGDVIGIIGAAEDITERKKTEGELKKHQEHLEELVQEKTKQLNDRLIELERFHDATIEREYRIKELRDEINSIKELDS